MSSRTHQSSYVVFETALGFVALAWSDDGLTRLILPDGNRQAVANRMMRTGAAEWRRAAPPPSFVLDAMQRIEQYACGVAVDMASLPFDLGDIPAFDRAILAAALKLGFGQVTTYGELAEQAGFGKLLARETGAALGRNPLPLVIPCHRILAAGGKIGGFSAPGGAVTKQRMLAHEGVRLGPPEPAQASFGF